jgi:hypothetical protein
LSLDRIQVKAGPAAPVLLVYFLIILIFPGISVFGKAGLDLYRRGYTGLFQNPVGFETMPAAFLAGSGVSGGIP